MSKNIKLILILLIVCLLGILAGITGRLVISRSGPALADVAAVRLVLKAYFSAWQAENPEQMYDYISAEDRAVVSLAEYVQQFKDYPIAPLQYEFQQFKKGATDKDLQAEVLVYWPGVDEDDMEKRTEVFHLKKEQTWRIVEKESLAK